MCHIKCSQEDRAVSSPPHCSPVLLPERGLVEPHSGQGITPGRIADHHTDCAIAWPSPPAHKARCLAHETGPMVYHGIPWYTTVYHGMPWYTMAYHGKPWYTMVDHGIPWAGPVGMSHGPWACAMSHVLMSVLCCVRAMACPMSQIHMKMVPSDAIRQAEPGKLHSTARRTSLGDSPKRPNK